MPDKKTVITHLTIIRTWASFARERDLQFFTAKHLEDMATWADEAIALLKEQEEVVRCKDCRHSGFCNTEDVHRCTNPDGWFCADGKRR